MLDPTDLESRINSLELEIVRLKSQVKSNSNELGANSRGTLTFLGMLIVMVLLGSRFNPEIGYTYQIEIEKLTTLLTVPAIAGLFAAVIPGLRK